MLEDNPIFITEAQKDSLREAYSLIESIKANITWDYEEYSAINTSLEYLKNAINFKQKFF